VSCSDSYFFGRDIYRMDTSVPIGLVENYTLRFAASGSDTVSASLAADCGTRVSLETT